MTWISSSSRPQTDSIKEIHFSLRELQDTSDVLKLDVDWNKHPGIAKVVQVLDHAMELAEQEIEKTEKRLAKMKGE
ncbi:hypothetical protein SEA_WEASELS2_219 [Rhodococcus phage Weasels2]|uniref:Uncharacterized protein n=1 Tax=Rhodococcus phage Weasels2 TaxID=1897437 RepID=A0A1I9SAJ1_9CAUD|nr:hypothetical protein FDH04_gp197 [Rhodococcus phage Weasels2]AOZ63797.1 hypothetical protein SEA_WEASELS2_219 [Rhodococcus phage Weasels2]